MKFGVEVADMVGPPGKKDKEYGKGKPDDEAAEGETEDGQDPEESAAEEFQSAIKDGSPADVVEAFKKLMDICG